MEVTNQTWESKQENVKEQTVLLTSCTAVNLVSNAVGDRQWDSSPEDMFQGYFVFYGGQLHTEAAWCFLLRSHHPVQTAAFFFLIFLPSFLPCLSPRSLSLSLSFTLPPPPPVWSELNQNRLLWMVAWLNSGWFMSANNLPAAYSALGWWCAL